MKELLFSVTRKDFDIQFYRGTGNGGQKKNKTSNCCRITHKESGATATSEEGRSQAHNKQNAFKKMTATKEFQNWLKIKIAEANGQKAIIEEYVDRQMKSENLKVEGFIGGKWVQAN